ncbi:ABC transporter ATP-binding protein [Phycicoccus flavus]|uniref:ABC transporter ATP-binding protein n=1 Tax=Phycicoccus flavus TaxID=2502783 RepID=A0A8T6R4I3_9MICO|nr:ABC transporter ATP-binding protein [Phycicoccus flavus]NHA67705.1 ABC transporter ATP-binding protein [Phycicoccus flavus]
MPTALECRNVSFRYHKRRPVLDGVTFAVERGQIFGLLGPNGAGKSTLVKILLGLNRAGEGSVTWFGEPLTTRTRRRIGYVPQDLALLYDLSAHDNVRFFGRLNGMSGKHLEERTRTVLDFVGLWDERGKQPGEYSGGMKRRLNIACGIVHDPDVVIMDEPTVGVDPQSRNHILESIETLRDQGTTVVYISHYMEEVERLCTTIGVIDEGTYLCGGTLEELLHAHAPEAIVDLELTTGTTVDADDLAGLEILEQRSGGVSVSVPEGQLDVMRLIADRFDDKVQRFTYIPPNLEQVFFRLTKKALRD